MYRNFCTCMFSQLQRKPYLNRQSDSFFVNHIFFISWEQLDAFCKKQFPIYIWNTKHCDPFTNCRIKNKKNSHKTHHIPAMNNRTIRRNSVFISLSPVMYQVSTLPVQSYLSITWGQTLANGGKLERPETMQALSHDDGVREQPKSLCNQSVSVIVLPIHAPTANKASQSHPSIQRGFVKKQRHHRVSASFITRSMMWAHNITFLPRSNPSVCLSLHPHSSVTPGGGPHRGHFVLRTVFSLSERFLSHPLTPSVSSVLRTSLSLLILGVFLSTICSLRHSVSRL